MKLFATGGCPARRELFDIELRQCDGQQSDNTPLQQPLRDVIMTYNKMDVV